MPLNRKHPILSAVAVAGIIAGASLDRALFAAQQPTIKRTELGRLDVPAGPNYEGVMAIAEIPSGGTSGKHRHPGIEMAYVLEGTVNVKYEDGSTKTFKAGDAMQNHGVHNATNTAKTPVKILAVYFIEKGKPIAEPVP